MLQFEAGPFLDFGIGKLYVNDEGGDYGTGLYLAAGATVGATVIFAERAECGIEGGWLHGSGSSEQRLPDTAAVDLDAEFSGPIARAFIGWRF